MVNKKDCPMKLVSIIRKNDKAKRFTITEGYKAIIMPIFTPFFNIVKDNTFIKRDIYICSVNYCS